MVNGLRNARVIRVLLGVLAGVFVGALVGGSGWAAPSSGADEIESPVDLATDQRSRVEELTCGGDRDDLRFLVVLPNDPTASCEEGPRDFFRCSVNDRVVVESDCDWGCTSVRGESGCFGASNHLWGTLSREQVKIPFFTLYCEPEASRGSRIYHLQLSEGEECHVTESSDARLEVECGVKAHSIAEEGFTWVPKLRANCKWGCDAVAGGNDCTLQRLRQPGE